MIPWPKLSKRRLLARLVLHTQLHASLGQHQQRITNGVLCEQRCAGREFPLVGNLRHDLQSSRCKALEKWTRFERGDRSHAVYATLPGLWTLRERSRADL